MRRILDNVPVTTNRRQRSYWLFTFISLLLIHGAQQLTSEQSAIDWTFRL